MTDSVFSCPRSPWKSEFGTYAHSPSGESPIVVGNIPTFTRPSSESVPVEHFHTAPYGVPWAIDTYQNRPSGETATLCGPLSSLAMSLTEISLTFRQPLGPTSIRETTSPDSLDTYSVYGVDAVGCAQALEAKTGTSSVVRQIRITSPGEERGLRTTCGYCLLLVKTLGTLSCRSYGFTSSTQYQQALRSSVTVLGLSARILGPRSRRETAIHRNRERTSRARYPASDGPNARETYRTASARACLPWCPTSSAARRRRSKSTPHRKASQRTRRR